MHDIVVGLLCFDVLYLPLGSLHKIHILMGSEAFWRLVDADAVRLVHTATQPAVIFRDADAVSGGDLGCFSLRGSGSAEANSSAVSVGELIRRPLSAADGKEEEAERLFSILESKVELLPPSPTGAGLPEKVRSALAHPSIRRLLGVSGGTSALAIPRWVTYPVLRLAGVIATGDICQHINAAATRMIWGSERLATAAFSASAAQEWADEAASYVLTGAFNCDVGALVAADADLLPRILTFRESQTGESFRHELADRLKTNEGSEVVASINAGLRQMLPTALLQDARDQVSGLFAPRERLARMTPALWGDLRNGDQRIANWRKRSRQLLVETCNKLRIQPYDPCPCGSGEKLKFCCHEALRV